MRKIDGFWDSSAVVPLCVDQGASPFLRAVRKSQSMTVWWNTPVEVTSAFARLLRDSQIGSRGFEWALQRLGALEKSWIEVQPTDRVRELARWLIQKHPLRAAGGLQLAAALVWSQERPRGRPFLCLDGKLAQAALAEGFSVEVL